MDVTLGDNRLNENVVNHYNALNQLTSTLTKDSKVSFTYDAEGLRTSKTVNGEETLYIWDNDQIVLELTKSGKVKKRYIRGNDLLYADEGEGTDKTYYAMNPHGDVVQLIDEQGNVTKTYEYDSFGNELEEDSKDDNPFRYCGEYYDKETGEVYLRARYYQPGVGRFLTRDTYTGQQDDPLSLHLYAYCEYDGVNAVDPSGYIKLKTIWNIYTLGTPIITEAKIRTATELWRASALGKLIAKDTASGENEKTMNFFDFDRDKDGVYHTRQNCWQAIGGYNKLYEFVFGAATDMEAKIFKLPTSESRFNLNKKYILWAWKGDYFNLGPGGEMGIYSTRTTIHCFAETKNPIYSSLKVYRKSSKKWLFTWKPGYLSWWITGFKPGEPRLKKATDLKVVCTADFSKVSSDLREAFFKKVNKKSFKKYWKSDEKKKTATFTW